MANKTPTQPQQDVRQRARELASRGGPFNPGELTLIYQATDALNGGPLDAIDLELKSISRACRPLPLPKAARKPTKYDKAIEEVERRLSHAILAEEDAREAVFRAKDEFDRLSTTTWMSDGHTSSYASSERDYSPEKLAAAKEALKEQRDAWLLTREVVRRARHAVHELSQKRTLERIRSE